MIRNLIILFGFLVTTHFAVAQNLELIIKSSDNSLYLDHKVAPKENFFAIGRLYNLPAKDIAAFNKLDIAKPLAIDQVIRIPLQTANFSQSVNEGAPVYYKTADKESLSKISSSLNNVSAESLRGWNNITGDNISAGTKLVVGFLLTKEMPGIKIPVSKNSSSKPAVAEKAESEPVKMAKETSEPVKPVDKIVTEKPVVEKTIVEKPAVINESVRPDITGNGYFKAYFDQQVKINPVTKEATVTSGIFKTTSGWQDAKYYLLIDKVEPGTIVRVVNPTNNKAVYAKVLYGMEGIRQNLGLDIRISNAAASALEIAEPDKFIVKVNY